MCPHSRTFGIPKQLTEVFFDHRPHLMDGVSVPVIQQQLGHARGSPTEALVMIEDWRIEYNTRPHSSRGGPTSASTLSIGINATPNYSHNGWTHIRGPSY